MHQPGLKPGSSSSRDNSILVLLGCLMHAVQQYIITYMTCYSIAITKVAARNWGFMHAISQHISTYMTCQIVELTKVAARNWGLWP